MTRLMHLLVVVAVLMVSCGSTAVEDGAPPDAGTEAPTAVPAEPTATSLPEPTATAVPTAAPEPGGGEELRAERVEQVVDVVLAVLNGERAMSEADYDTFFADGFRAQVPYATFQGINAQLAPSAPWSVVEPLVQGRDRGQMLVENAAGDRVTVGVAIVEGEVTELLLQPWTEPVTDVAEAFELLEGIGEFAYLIAEVTDADDCRRIDELDADRAQPLGSVFKLLVLGAVVDEIAAGELSWDDPVTIRDELDSLPSGVTQIEAPGSTRTVRELAEVMISISDNTATDHLLFLVGRETVEAAQARWGIEDPSLNVPFVSTKELFHLKLSEELRTSYVAATVDERRSILDELADVALPSIDELADIDDVWSSPIEIDTLEWFATPADICRVLGRLALDPDARAILETSPGVPSAQWERVGFKGGSEPGVLAVAWVVEDETGRIFTVTGGVWNKDEVFDHGAALEAFAAVRDGFDAEPG